MGEVTDILEFLGLFSTWVSIHFVRFYVMFYRLGLTLEGAFGVPPPCGGHLDMSLQLTKAYLFCDQKR